MRYDSSFLFLSGTTKSYSKTNTRAHFTKGLCNPEQNTLLTFT